MKKNNKGISSIVIVLIVTVILIVIIGILFFCFSKKDNSMGGIGDIFLEKEDTNTTYDLKFAGRWGDPNLGISYLVPYRYSFSTSSKIYPNGQQYELGNLDEIIVETLLDDSTDVSLDNLADAIFKQKSSKDYSDYNHSSLYSGINITSSKECLIDNLKVLYYEGSMDLNNPKAYSSNCLTIGYSFIFNEKNVNVQAFHWDHSSSDILETKQYLIKIIQSMQKYDGQLFSEINEEEYDFNSLFRSITELELDNKKYYMAVPSSTTSDVFYNSYATPTYLSISNLSLYSTKPENLELFFNNATKEELLESENPIQTILEKGKSDSISDKIEIVKEENCDISGINMKKTVVVEYEYVKQVQTDKYSIIVDIEDNTLYPTNVTTYYSFKDGNNVFYTSYTNSIDETKYIIKQKLEERPRQEELDKKKEIAQFSSERIMDTMIRSLIIEEQN